MPETQGKWEVVPVKDYWGAGSLHWKVAATDSTGHRRIIADNLPEPLARLIAAAPEMAELLDGLTSDQRWTITPEIHKQIRTLLARI